MRLSNIVFCIILSLSIINCKEKITQEKEPNNSYTYANEIYLQKPIQGFINTRDDKDFYLLVLDETRVLDVHVSGIKGVNRSIDMWKGLKNPVLVKQEIQEILYQI